MLQRPTYGSERKNVSILFADLTGSLELLEDDPEQARDLLEGVLERMSAAVRQYGGTVTQAMGDGILAVFGAPLAYEDHAFRACHAALAMQERFASDDQGDARKLAIRVGVHSGEVVVGERGDGLDAQYAAFGRTAHLASRIEGLADPGCVLISEPTWRLVCEDAEARPLGPTRVRGLAEPVELFELVSVASRWHRTNRGAVIPFVGRDAELAMLGYALSEAALGHGRVVAISGEAGVGKSRLIEEFLRTRAASECLVLQTFGIAHSKPEPFGGVTEALSRCFQLADAGDGQSIGDRIRLRLQDLGVELESHLPALLALFGDDGGGHWMDQPANQRQKNIVHAVFGLLAAESRHQPVIIVLDDVQFIDSETLGIFSQIVKLISDRRILMLVAYRPEYKLGWDTSPHFLQMPLECLRGDRAESFLDALLGDDPGLAALRLTLVNRTGGNPFFLEEIVHALVAAGTLAGENNRYSLVAPVRDQDIPPKVQDIIAMRIDRLNFADKRLLQIAAAYGYEIEVTLLAAIADVSEEQLWTNLSQLVEMEFLLIASHPTNDVLQFKHPLTHDVAYQSLLRREQKRLHRRILAVLEGVQQGRISFETLAFHAERAAEPGKAVEYLKAAGEQALSRSASRHALHCFEQATEVLTQWRDAVAKTEAEIDLRLEIRNALLPLGRHGDILPHLRRAEALSRQLSDEGRLARVLSCISHYYWLVGEWHNAIEEGQHAVQAADALKNSGLMVTTRFVLGLARYSTGNLDEAIGNLKFNARMLRGAKARERFGMLALPAVVSRGYLALCLAERGDFKAAFGPAREAKAIAEQSGRAFDQVQGFLGICHVLLLVGQPREAVGQLEQALALCEEADIRVLVPRVAACLGYAYSLEGRVEQSLQMAERALQQADALSLAAMRSLCLRWAGEVKLLGGQVAEALDIADGLWRHCRSSGEAGHEASALYLLGSALADMGRFEESADALDRAMSLAQELGMLPLLAHCRRRLGAVEVARGRHEEGQHHSAGATAIYRKLDMVYWLKGGG